MGYEYSTLCMHTHVGLGSIQLQRAESDWRATVTLGCPRWKMMGCNVSCVVRFNPGFLKIVLYFFRSLILKSRSSKPFGRIVEVQSLIIHYRRRLQTTCTCVHAYMCTCVHAYMCTCVHAYMCACMIPRIL
jgi:hypothetical protein